MDDDIEKEVTKPSTSSSPFSLDRFAQEGTSKDESPISESYNTPGTSEKIKWKSSYEITNNEKLRNDTIVRNSWEEESEVEEKSESKEQINQVNISASLERILNEPEIEIENTYGSKRACGICQIKLNLEEKYGQPISDTEFKKNLCEKHKKLISETEVSRLDTRDESSSNNMDENNVDKMVVNGQMVWVGTSKRLMQSELNEHQLNFIYKQKIRSIARALERNACEVDLKLSLYIIACSSGNPTTFLHPYPYHIYKDNIASHRKMVRLNGEIPHVKFLRKYLYSTEKPGPDREMIDVLHWLLVGLGQPRLVSLQKRQVAHVLSSVVQNVVKKPSVMFKLMCSQFSDVESRWRYLKQGRHSSFGFYSMRLENAFSVLHEGITSRLYEGGVGGVGIYMTNDLTTALERSPEGEGWDNSYIGTRFSLIAIVEFIEHPSVRYYKAGSDTDFSDANETRIPIIYFVPKSEYTRVRYILVYSTQTAVQPSPVQRQSLVKRIMDHKALPYVFACLIVSFATLRFFRQAKTSSLVPSNV